MLNVLARILQEKMLEVVGIYCEVLGRLIVIIHNLA